MSPHFILAGWVKCPGLNSFNKFGLKHGWKRDHSHHISDRVQVDFLKQIKPLQISNDAFESEYKCFVFSYFPLWDAGLLFIYFKNPYSLPTKRVIDVQKIEVFALFSNVLYESAKMRALGALQTFWSKSPFLFLRAYFKPEGLNRF